MNRTAKSNAKKGTEEDYSRLPPCGHLAVTNNPLLRAEALFPADTTKKL